VGGGGVGGRDSKKKVGKAGSKQIDTGDDNVEGEHGDGYQRLTFGDDVQTGGYDGSTSGGGFGVGSSGFDFLLLIFYLCYVCTHFVVDCGAGQAAVGLFTNTEFASILYRIQHGESTAKLLLSREGLKQMSPTVCFFFFFFLCFVFLFLILFFKYIINLINTLK
jgi:hypothetical protein